MDKLLEVTIPLIIDDINDVSALKKAVATSIMEHQDSFHQFLDRLIQMGDARITVIDDSLNIEGCDVNLDSFGGVAEGTFDSDFYAGCKDMNSVDEHAVILPFKIENTNLVFSIELPPEWIPDYD
jgi:hypothetical protein